MSLAVTYVPSHELTERFMINLSHRYLAVPPSQPPTFLTHTSQPWVDCPRFAEQKF